MCAVRVTTSKVDKLLSSLIEERLDDAKSRTFATLIIKKAGVYKPTRDTEAEQRRKLTQLVTALKDAALQIDVAASSSAHQSVADLVSTYAVGKLTNPPRFTKSGVWNRILKQYWPGIERVPPIEVLREYLHIYADVAEHLAMPKPGRGKPIDFEGYRVVLYCAGAWVEAFGTKPGTGETSPFVRACKHSLPLFGTKTPRALHAHIRNALKGWTLDKLRAASRGM